MPRFKTIDGDLYDVGEYKEGHYYLVDDEGNISETTLQELTKIRMSRHLLGFVYFVLVASGFVFFIVGFFYPLFKTLTTKGTSSRL